MFAHFITAIVAFTVGFLAAGLFAAARRRDDAYPWPPGPAGGGSEQDPA